MMKKLFLALLILGLMAGGYGIYLWKKQPPTAQDSAADFILESGQLIRQLDSSTSAVSKKYMDKNLSISGVITQVDAGQISIGAGENASVSCSFDSTYFAGIISRCQPGRPVQVKGIFYGAEGFDPPSDDDLDLIPTEKIARLKTCYLVTEQP